MGSERSAADGSFRSPAAWQEAELLGSAELLHRTRDVTLQQRGQKTASRPKMYQHLEDKGLYQEI